MDPKSRKRELDALERDHEFLLKGEETLEMLYPEIEGLQHQRFRHLLGPGLNHHDPFRGSGHDQV